MKIPTPALALRGAADEAARRNTDLIVLAALSGSDQPAAAGLETSALRADITGVLGDAGWQPELVEPGVDYIGALVEYLDPTAPELVVLGTRHRSPVGKLLLERDHRRLLLEITAPILLFKHD